MQAPRRIIRVEASLWGGKLSRSVLCKSALLKDWLKARDEAWIWGVSCPRGRTKAHQMFLSFICQWLFIRFLRNDWLLSGFLCFLLWFWILYHTTTGINWYLLSSLKWSQLWGWWRLQSPKVIFWVERCYFLLFFCSDLYQNPRITGPDHLGFW